MPPIDSHDVECWIAENKKDFEPPVCNKCMFSDELKLFYVGGPNQRRDYHLEEGEELFYQLKGDMLLKVVEKGRHVDVPIREGEIFLLPARVEHSPQRFQGTVGMVLERTRLQTELDCVRYFVGDSTRRQYERWFHLNDVVKDLPPVIRGFHASDSFKKGEPTEESFISTAPFEPRDIELERPFSLAKWAQENRSALSAGKPVQIFGEPKYRTPVVAYGSGAHALEAVNREQLLWLVTGSATVTTTSGGKLDFSSPRMIRVAPGESVHVSLPSNQESVLLVVSMPPLPSV